MTDWTDTDYGRHEIEKHYHEEALAERDRLAYTIIVGSHCLGTVETRDVNAADMFGAAIEISRRQWGRPVMLSVYDDGEARPCWAADCAFQEAIEIGRKLYKGEAFDADTEAAKHWAEAKDCARLARRDDANTVVGSATELRDHAREELFAALYWRRVAKGGA